MQWIKFRILASPFYSEALSFFLLEKGANGIEELGEADNLAELTAYFKPQEEASVSQELSGFISELSKDHPNQPPIQVTRSFVEDDGWSENWKNFCKPQPLSRGFYLIPSWTEDSAPEGMQPIRIDPGMAFGTGLHESTRLCIEHLEEQLRSDVKAVSLLDVGTGSGILSIVAAKLGVTDIIGIDIDEDAIEVAKENCTANEAKVCLSSKPIEEVTETFDFVVANILLGTHLQLMPQYAKRLKAKGLLLLSGLLVSQEEEINASLETVGFKTLQLRKRHEWLSLLAVKQGGNG